MCGIVGLRTKLNFYINICASLEMGKVAGGCRRICVGQSQVLLVECPVGMNWHRDGDGDGDGNGDGDSAKQSRPADK